MDTVLFFFFLIFLKKFYFTFKLYTIVLVLPNIEMNPPQVLNLRKSKYKIQVLGQVV